MTLPLLLQSVAEVHKVILYRPEFNQVTGSVTASILFNQVIFWASQSKGEPFYKFLQPCGHDLYREGDSWCEELGFSYKELSGAIAKIGTKITKGISKADVIKGEGSQSLVIYWTDASRVTWWQLNVDLAEGMLAELYQPNRQKGNYLNKSQNENYLGNRQKGNYLQNAKKGITYSYTENTTEKTFREKGDDDQISFRVPTLPTESLIVVQKEDQPPAIAGGKKGIVPPQGVAVTAKWSRDMGGLMGGRSNHRDIAQNNISAFKSPEEKVAFTGWAVSELEKSYPQAIALDKAGWAVRNLDQNKQDDLLAVDLLKRYRNTPAKFGRQSPVTSLLDELVAIAKSNPSEAQKRANETERNEGKPANFYWNKVLGAL